MKAIKLVILMIISIIMDTSIAVNIHTFSKSVETEQAGGSGYTMGKTLSNSLAQLISGPSKASATGIMNNHPAGNRSKYSKDGLTDLDNTQLFFAVVGIMIACSCLLGCLISCCLCCCVATIK